MDYIDDAKRYDTGADLGQTPTVDERHGMNGNPQALGENDHWEIFSDTETKYRWRRIASNDEVVGASSESYLNKFDCVSNAKRNGI